MDSLDVMESKLDAMGFHSTSCSSVFAFGAQLAALNCITSDSISEIIQCLVDEGHLSKSDSRLETHTSAAAESFSPSAGSSDSQRVST